MHHFPVQGEGFHRRMRRPEDGAARGFVHPPGFQAHVAVFHQVHPADAVFAAEVVEPGQEIGGAEALAVHRHRVAVLEVDLHVLRLIRGRPPAIW